MKENKDKPITFSIEEQSRKYSTTNAAAYNLKDMYICPGFGVETSEIYPRMLSNLTLSYV